MARALSSGPRTQPPASLKSFSTGELLEEVGRRSASPDRQPPKFRPCDECQNFQAWNEHLGPIDLYNPCLARHDMSFKMPAGYTDTDWGFYRRVCPDRLAELPA